VTVSGGLLHIGLRKQVVGASQYSAGGLISREQFRYGFYEARIRFPAKRSWHGAFWTMAVDPQNPGVASAAVARQELDVIEHDSGNNNFTVHIHTHHPADLNLGLKGITSKDLATGFHVFGCEFTPQEVRCFFDGRLVLTADVSTVEHDDQNIWLTCIRGPGAMDDTALPAEMVVDYVRFFAPEPQ
jgi:beta-glucanase (GH16 family)